MTSNTSSIKSFVETFVTKHRKSDIIYKIDMNKSKETQSTTMNVITPCLL